MNTSELASGFLASLRMPVDLDAPDDAQDALRYGAQELDDETLWTTTMLIVEGAADDGERWMIGDSLIDESIATRPGLRRRWHAARASYPSVDAVFRVMLQAAENEGWDLGWWDPSDPFNR